MQLHDNLLTVFTAKIEEHDGQPVIHLPVRELELDTLSSGDTVQVALHERAGTGEETAASESQTKPQRRASSSEPPVQNGEQLEVEIEDVGDQGDGIAKVGPGYVIFVPDTELGDRITIEVTQTQENFAFAEVVTPEPVTG